MREFVDFDMVSEGNYAGHSHGMEAWGFKKMIERWLTDPRVKMIVRDKDFDLGKASGESGWAVEQVLDMNQATKAVQRFWDGMPPQRTLHGIEGRPERTDAVDATINDGPE
jgi:hypothetical protein